MSGETLASVYASLANWLTYVGLLGLTGAATGQLMIQPLCRRQGGAADVPWSSLTDRFLRVATLSASLLVVAMAGKLYAQTYAVFGLDEPVTFDLIRLVAIETRWGGQWRPQVFAALFALFAVLVVRWAPRTGWWLVAAGICALVVALPMTGHAMAHAGGATLPWTLQVGHGAAAGLWVGTLAVMLVAFTVLRAEPRDDRGIATLVHAFSPVALGAVTLLVATGAWTSVLYLGDWRELWLTPWGRALLLKVGLMLATGAVGAYNWRRVRPRLGASAATATLIRSSRLELTLAGLVLLVTSILVHLPMSHE